MTHAQWNTKKTWRTMRFTCATMRSARALSSPTSQKTSGVQPISRRARFVINHALSGLGQHLQVDDCGHAFSEPTQKQQECRNNSHKAHLVVLLYCAVLCSIVPGCAGVPVLQPVYVYYDFRLEEVLKDFFLFAEWLPLWLVRPQGDDAHLPGSYGCGTEYRRLCAELGCDVLGDRPAQNGRPSGSCGLWTLHLDWVQPYNRTQHSTGILGISCSSLGDAHKSRQSNIRPLAIIPGPTSPKCIDGILRRTAIAFSVLWETGLELPNGLGMHYPILDALSADQPACNKVSKAMGASSYKPCMGCKFTGYAYQLPPKPGKQPTKHIFFKGYSEPAIQGGSAAG